ncbi:MAG: aminotransferase class III-fold pyridoxal phosphate-dependent enzyme, partial [Actinomycetota bacterium]
MRDTQPSPPSPAAQADTLEAPPPAFTLQQASELARSKFGVDGKASPLVSERDQNFRILRDDGTGFVPKIMNPAEDPGVAEMQTLAMLHVAETDPGLPVMRLVPSLDGEVQSHVTGPDGREHVVRIVTLMPGRTYEPDEMRLDALPAFGAASARLARALRGFVHPSADHPLLWNIRNALDLRPLVPNIEDPRRRAIAERVLDRFEQRVHPAFGHLRAQVIHNDLTSDNALFDDDQRISGVIDFGDMAHTATVCELVSTVEALMGERPDHFETLAATASGFASGDPVRGRRHRAPARPAARHARWTTTATISAWRSKRYPENAEYITGWDAGVWAMLDLWDEIGDAEYQRRIHEAVAAATGAPTTIAMGASLDELIERRRRLFGPAISPLTYDRPLHLVSARGAWMTDADGRSYLDAYNNVPVVGHCHPHVVEAIARQAALLNTNTRYLHRSALDLAERLVASMPEGLATVMFVNSGSEANDLAWRMARVATGHGGALVTTFAYHGVTTATSDLSPEEWLGAGRPPHVATFPPPDPFRGPFGEAEGWSSRAAASVDVAIASLRERGLEPAMVMIDPGFISDGVFSPPDGYLRDVVERVHGAGGLYVADEVQVGYGRNGRHLWGFQVHGLEPDFVTLGKPMGNGHPVAAVITRSSIAERFAAETEFFSTYGGNPVAAEAALAVLDVIEREGLIANAGAMGTRLTDGVRTLAERHDAIGDVRSAGLLLGVELVRDRETREPAADVADAVL